MPDVFHTCAQVALPDGQVRTCLAACEDQVNLITETSSAFPNSETFHRRREFCLLVRKLVRTCASIKAGALQRHFPQLCNYLHLIFKGKVGNGSVEESQVCSRGYWNAELDHPHLLEPIDET